MARSEASSEARPAIASSGTGEQDDGGAQRRLGTRAGMQDQGGDHPVTGPGEKPDLPARAMQRQPQPLPHAARTRIATAGCATRLPSTRTSAECNEGDMSQVMSPSLRSGSQRARHVVFALSCGPARRPCSRWRVPAAPSGSARAAADRVPSASGDRCGRADGTRRGARTRSEPARRTAGHRPGAAAPLNSSAVIVTPFARSRS